MKLTITDLKIFIFCLFNVLAIHIGVAQNTPINGFAIEDKPETENNDEILKTPFGVFNLSQTTGSVFRISGDDLRKTSGDNLSEALRGRVPGLRIVRGSNTPGNDSGYSYILNGGTPYFLIDGQPRGLQVDLREVQEVIVLSDATFNSLLGTLGDNGLIYVITKGGKPSVPTIEVNFQTGYNTATKLPDLLSSSEYANVINRAASNDGLAPFYSEEAIAAYKNGSDPIKYPNVDYQDTFIKDFSRSNYASLGIYGGKEKVSYSAFLGYSDWQGLEKVGTDIDGRDITFRTKINAKINDLISTHASVYGDFGENNRPVIGADYTFNLISTTPANSHPLKVGDSAYVVSNQFNTSLLSELEKGGSYTEYSANVVFDLGLDFDFKDYVPGLKYDTYVMVRNNNAQVLKSDSRPGTYTLNYLEDISGQDSLALKEYAFDYVNLNVSRQSSTIQRNYTYGGNLSYIRNVGDGLLNLNFNHLLYYQPNRESTQPDNRNLTYNLNGSYSLKNKYIMFANMNMSSSNKFIGDNRTALFPTVGLSWVASNEDFLNDNKVIDYLKFRSSYGQVGTEYTTSTYFYLDTWAGGKNNGTMYLGVDNTTQNNFGYRMSATANESVDWVVYNQFFAGLELNMLKKLNLTVNYFDIKIDGQVINADALYSDALGDNAFLPQVNYTERRNRGFNANITYSETSKPFKYYASFNAGYNKITSEKIAEVQYPDAYRLRQGQDENDIIGFVSDGLFTAENIGDALPQFGDVQIGDIKYVDQNNDNVIDDRDRRAIGNNTPKFNYGINVGVSYKGFNFDVVGMGVANYDINLNGVDYYNHSGLGNYYGSVNKNLPNGNANPRLSTSKSINNFTNSDYWLVDGGYFRISNAELGYTLSNSLFSNSSVNNVKLFLRGSNLAVFSKIKDLDPEDLRSGILEYPMMRSFVLGASLNF